MATAVWTFIILLLIGGILIFVVPTVTLTAAFMRGKRAYLDRISVPMANVVDKMIGEVGDEGGVRVTRRNA